MRRLAELSARAADELKSAQRWFTQPGSGRVAHAKLVALTSAVRDLRRTPCTWPVGQQAGTRERFVAGYVIVYRVTLDTGENRTAGDVRILRIFGPGQDRSAL